MKARIASLLALITLSCCGPAQHVDAKNFAADQKQIVVRNATPNYKPCPPTLRVTCELAVLEGNPREEGLFTIRIRTTEPFVVTPHNHPASERVTVLHGRLNVGFGTELDKTTGLTFEQGDYYVNKRGEHHYVWSDEPVELQITGLGPWEMHFHD